jgi:hypothetical protein
MKPPFFTAGQVRARDGTIEEAAVTDIAGERRPEAVVIVRSAGTAGYLSAHAFAIDKQLLSFSLFGLPSDRVGRAAVTTSWALSCQGRARCVPQARKRSAAWCRQASSLGWSRSPGEISQRVRRAGRRANRWPHEARGTSSPHGWAMIFSAPVVAGRSFERTHRQPFSFDGETIPSPCRLVARPRRAARRRCWAVRRKDLRYAAQI